jgi:hypothetical protein
MRAYLMKRNNWDRLTFDSISWDAHGASHSYHRAQRVFLIKLCHRHLAIGKKLHRRDSKYPATCPGCNNNTIENHDHFIGCPAPSRIKWRTELLSATRQQLDRTKTDSNFTEAIVNALDRAMAGRPISVGGPFQAALRAQERIGWRSLLQGYWAKEWQKCFQHTYAPPDEESADARQKRLTTMSRWQTSLIKVLWTQMIALWKLRNDERHGIDKDTRELSRHTVLINELELLYINRTDYTTAAQNLLRTTFADHCRDKASQIEDWLHAYRVTFNVMRIRPNG